MAKIRKALTDKLTNNQGTSRSLKPTDLAGQAHKALQATARLSAATDLRKLSNGGLPTLKGIQFGSPSSSGGKSGSSAGAGSEWTSLVKTASGGVTSLIGGGFLESGINSLISGLTSLFDGGGKSETPLVRFVLSDPQQQTMYTSSSGLSASANIGAAPRNTQPQGPVYRQADIVQAVRNALLTSSSLNDVIAEI